MSLINLSSGIKASKGVVPDAGPLRLIPDLGLPASGAGANVLRIAGGNGIKLAKSAIASNEVRNDGMSTRGRHGTQQVSAAYHAEASLGALDPIIEAIMRGAWDTTAFYKMQADFMSLTTAVDGINFKSDYDGLSRRRRLSRHRSAGRGEQQSKPAYCGAVVNQDHDSRATDGESYT